MDKETIKKKTTTTNNPKDPKAPAPASNKPELTPKMAAKDTLQAPEPLYWFSAEMQKFVATIQISITIQLHQVDATLEKMSEAIPTRKLPYWKPNALTTKPLLWTYARG